MFWSAKKPDQPLQAPVGGTDKFHQGRRTSFRAEWADFFSPAARTTRALRARRLAV